MIYRRIGTVLSQEGCPATVDLQERGREGKLVVTCWDAIGRCTADHQLFLPALLWHPAQQQMLVLRVGMTTCM
jgi:hypothetical protein